MNWIKSNWKPTLSGLCLAAVLTGAVFLTGCSTPLANTVPGLGAGILSQPKAELPSPPPNLVKCLKTGLGQRADAPKTVDKLPDPNAPVPKADEKVINLMSYAEEKRACGLKMVNWYEGVRESNKDK